MIACLSIPYFVAAVERRAGRGQDGETLAVGGQPWEPRPAYAFSQEAASRGVRPGMSLRTVQLLSPDARFLPTAAPHYAQVSGEIVDVLTDFSPDIEPQELWHAFPESALAVTAHSHSLPTRYCLDLDGLPQTEAVPLVQEMGRQVRAETRFAPAVGLAADPFTAQVAAAICRPSHLLPVAPETAAEFLSSRPLSFLPLGKETARRLHLMGIRTLGQFAQLPTSALREQFDAGIERFHRLAHGQSDKPLRRQPAERYEEARRDFDPPVENALLLADALTRLAGELARRLQAANLEAGRLRLSLTTEDGRDQQQSLALRRSTAGAGRLADGLQELAATMAPSCPIAQINIAVTDLRPATAYQLGLFAPQSGDSSPLHRAMQRLVGKHRQCGFYIAALTEHSHPLPERRFQLESLAHDPALA